MRKITFLVIEFYHYYCFRFRKLVVICLLGQHFFVIKILMYSEPTYCNLNYSQYWNSYTKAYNKIQEHNVWGVYTQVVRLVSREIREVLQFTRWYRLAHSPLSAQHKFRGIEGGANVVNASLTASNQCQSLKYFWQPDPSNYFKWKLIVKME